MKRATRIAAALWLAIVAAVPTQALAADQDALYSKAEDLIRYTDDVKGLQALMSQGLQYKKAGKNSQGRTLLVSASTEGKLAMMDVLIKAGVDPNIKDESGMTALRQVAWTGKNQVAVAKRLIAAKTDVNIRGDDDWTPLIQAMYADPAVAVPLGQVLLQAGADASVVNNEGNTALSLAAERGLVALIPALVKNKTNVNERTRDGTAFRCCFSLSAVGRSGCRCGGARLSDSASRTLFGWNGEDEGRKR